MEKKKCTKCKIEKPMSTEYFPHSSGKDGLSSWCKECHRQYYLDTREKKLAYASAYRKSHSKKISDYKAERRKDPVRVEKDRAYGNRHYAEHKEDYVKRAAAWGKEHPEVKQTSNGRRRSRAKNLDTQFSTADWNRCLSYFGNRCAYCGRESGTLHQEHVIPSSFSGGFLPSNIIPSCLECNSSKGTTEMEKWFRKQPFFSEDRLERIRQFLRDAE